jgi:hypothetical protein
MEIIKNSALAFIISSFDRRIKHALKKAKYVQIVSNYIIFRSTNHEEHKKAYNIRFLNQ